MPRSTGWPTSEETSIAQEVAKVAPASASVVKAFNTIFRHVLEKGRPDVFIAGDNAQAKAGVEAFIESLGLRPLDVGGLKMAHWLEGVGVVTMGLAGHGVGHWDFALGVNEFHRLSRTAPGPSRRRTGAPCALTMADGSPRGLANARYQCWRTIVCPEKILAMKCATESCAVLRSSGEEKKAMTAPTPPTSTLVRPFTVSISDSEIDDVKQRLARTRWPDPETVGDWSQGVRVENARSLVDYWERGYDWRRFESELNRFPQFLTEIDGLDIHFIHVRSKNPNAMPLILTHGWPGSIVEFLKLIGPLTDPVSFGGDAADSFDVVVPSLPGFGFSQKPTETGWTVSRIASAWVELMKRLGYTRWAAQGGDWGAVVTTALGAMQPEGLLGIHLNTQYAFPAQIPDTLSPEQRYAVETLALYTGDLGGSNHLQGTKPETVGFALADSPAGQAAWIYDKFQSKTDNHGLAEDALSMDDMLDAISLYWFTNSAASSGRIYWENKSGTFAGPKLTLPVAVTVFPRDIPRLPRSWIEDTYSNLIHYGEADKGGHFAALEQPEILVSEIRTGLRTLRS